MEMDTKGTPTDKPDEAKAAPVNSAASEASKQVMYVKIYSPFKTYYDGEANSISAESQTGPFDILGHHHNFITLLTPCDVVVRSGTEEESYSIDGGIMHVKANDVVVFLDV